MATSNLTILAIDDNPDNLTTLRAVVTHTLPGARVLTALNGQKGIELAIDYDPDVVLLDIVMPVVDGFEVCRRLKSDKRLQHIPVIFLTAARTDAESRVQALESGAEAFLSKPIDATELTAQIRAMAKIKAANVLRVQERERLAALVAERTYELQQELAERKRAEEHLRESEEILRYIVQHDPNAIAVYDRELRYIAVSDRYLQDYGVKQEDILGKHHYDVFPEIPPRWKEVHRRCLAGAVEHSDDDSFERPDGSITYNRWECRPWRRPDGEIGGIITYTEVTTERKRAEQALRESEGKYRALYMSMRQGVFHQRADGTLLDANPAALEIFGVSEQEFTSRDSFHPGWRIIREDGSPFPGEEHPSVVALRTGKPARDVVAGIFNPRLQDYVWVTINAVPEFREAQSTPHRVAVTLHDITERKRAEEERQKLQLQLAQAQKMESVGRLAGGVAHDFNNLLTVINGYSELVLNTMVAEDANRVPIEEINKAGSRAAGLVRQLLAFSRKQVLRPEVLNLNGVIEGIEKMLHPLLGEDVEIITRLAPSQMVMADRHQLEQVIMNLVVNARDAMPSGGTLTIETGQSDVEDRQKQTGGAESQKRYSRLTVRDTGKGMDPFVREHLFEPFFTTKPVGKGTGLGLATVHGIVAQSGGHIEVESKPGEGSAFHIYIPVVTSSPQNATLHSAALAAGGSETILLVEDQEDVRQFTATVLESYGYQVLQAGDAEHALSWCSKQHVDLLMTDVVMPRMSGVELAKRARIAHPTLKTLFISGYTEEIHERHGRDLIGADFLQKPYSPEVLAARVRAALGARK